MQFMQHSAGVFDPMSQYQQQGGLQHEQQQQQQMFLMQPSPVMYNPSDQDTMTSTQHPHVQPGVFMSQQQDSMALFQQDISSPTVIMQTVFVPYPCDMQQVALPQGSLSFADPWAWPRSASKGWKGREGRPAARKKPTGALRPDEVQELKCAVQKQMKVLSKPALLCGSSKSDCSTAAGLSDAGANDASAEGSCRIPSGVADLDNQTHSCPHGCFAEKLHTALVDLDSIYDWERQGTLQWVSKSFWLLAFDKQGCRVVQKALDVSTPAYQLQLLENLQGYVNSAVESPHANYVLQKFIQIAPPENIQFIVTEVQDNVLHIARHRFGCRILQRLLENCRPSQTDCLINNALADAASLSRHQFGNFILQHILQYGSQSQRSAVADVVLADIIRLSKHRLASHIVSCALVHCSREDVQRLTHAVLCDEAQLYNLSRREYGSFVVREVHRAARLLESGGIQTDADVSNEIEDSSCTQDMPAATADVHCEQDMRTQTEGQFAVEMERQCTLDAYVNAMEWGRQCTVGAYMD